MSDTTLFGSSETRNEWLLPSVALSRAGPASAAHYAEAPLVQEAVRYGFRVGDFGFLVAEGVLCEVTLPPPTARIPHTPAWLHGVANLRGALVPVIELRTLLGSAGEREGRESLVVIDRGEFAVAIRIDGFPHTVRGLVPIAEVPPLPDPVGRHVSAAYSADQVVWLEWNHRALFAELAEGAPS